MKPRNNQKSMQCDICKKEFVYRHVLIRHRLIHTNQMNFKCDTCDKKFTRKDSLEAHQRKEHLSKNPFVCKFCDKVFGYKHSLVKHERIHTGEKPYSCRYCAKNFTRQDNMNKHQLIHEIRGAKFTCDICHNSFYKKNALRTHIKTHLKSIKKKFRYKVHVPEEKSNSPIEAQSSNQFPITEVYINENASSEEYDNELTTENNPLFTVEFKEIYC